MPLPPSPPPPSQPNPPAQQPPVTIVKERTPTVQEMLQEQVQNQEAESKSESASSSSNSASQTNVQINNTSNVIKYGSFHIPETTISASIYANTHDVGGVVTANFVTGGESRKLVKRALAIQVAKDNLNYEIEYANACVNIEKGGILVAKDAETVKALSNCGNEIQLVARSTPNPRPIQRQTSSSSEVSELKAEISELKEIIKQLSAQKSNTGARTGTY